MKTGNMIEHSIPREILPPKISAARPVIVDPNEQPTSPARARNANIAVPPPLRRLDAILKVPGQKIPTEKPHKAHPTSPRTGFTERKVRRYSLCSKGLRTCSSLSSNPSYPHSGRI